MTVGACTGRRHWMLAAFAGAMTLAAPLSAQTLPADATPPVVDPVPGDTTMTDPYGDGTSPSLTQGDATTTTTTGTTTTGTTASTGNGHVGERQRDHAMAGDTALNRISNRIHNRVENRLRNRIDPTYDPTANATAPFETADEQAKRRDQPDD